MTLWMMVSRDKYELPLIVADSAVELAEKAGVTANSIYSSIRHFYRQGYKTSRYRKVEVEYEEGEY